MRRFGTYLFLRTLSVFIGVLTTLVGIAWVTQALRKFDLVTAKGQAILLYLRITVLALPQIVAIIAPFAMVIAMIIVLSHLRADSGLIAITAAGASQRQVAVPFISVSLLVALFAAGLVLWVGPEASGVVSDIGNLVRADVVANVVQPGRFTEVDEGIVFHIRDRDRDGSFVDLFIDDERNPEFVFTYSAERGRIADVLGRSMIVMETGTMERTRKSDQSSTFVAFGSYAFDLSQLTVAPRSQRVQISERTLGDLLHGLAAPDSLPFPRDIIITDLMNRLGTASYPIAMGLAVFLFLGFPASNRRGQSGAISAALILSTAIRLAGFALLGITQARPHLAPLALAVPLALATVLFALIALGVRPALPASVDDLLDRLRRRLAPRLGSGADEEAT